MVSTRKLAGRISFGKAQEIISRRPRLGRRMAVEGSITSERQREMAAKILERGLNDMALYKDMRKELASPKNSLETVARGLKPFNNHTTLIGKIEQFLHDNKGVHTTSSIIEGIMPPESELTKAQHRSFSMDVISALNLLDLAGLAIKHPPDSRGGKKKEQQWTHRAYPQLSGMALQNNSFWRVLRRMHDGEWFTRGGMSVRNEIAPGHVVGSEDGLLDHAVASHALEQLADSGLLVKRVMIMGNGKKGDAYSLSEEARQLVRKAIEGRVLPKLRHAILGKPMRPSPGA